MSYNNLYMALASEVARKTRSPKEDKSLSISEFSSLKPRSFANSNPSSQMKSSVRNGDKIQTKNKRDQCKEQKEQRKDCKGKTQKRNTHSNDSYQEGMKKLSTSSKSKQGNHNDGPRKKKHARTFQIEAQKSKNSYKKSQEGKKVAIKFNDSRVSANSRVNFMFLTDGEQLERYRNMLQEYRSLKKTLEQKADNYYNQVSEYKKKQQLTQLKHGDHSLKRAKEIVKKQDFQIEDCSSILQNLSAMLAEKKLKGQSLEFDLLCSLILKIKSGNRGRHAYSSKIDKLLKDTSKSQYLTFLTGMGSLPKQESQTLRPAYSANFQRAQIMMMQPQAGFTFAWNQNMNQKELFQVSQPAVNLPMWNEATDAPANAHIGLNAQMLRRFNSQYPSPLSLSDAVNFRAP